MKRIIIIREEAADEKLAGEKQNLPKKISSHATCSSEFFLNRKLVSQKIFFSLTPRIISFTQHGLFCERPILN
jgi:hypothetical protein